MPFGYTSKVFSHPAVEYIPLLPLINQQLERTMPVDHPQLMLVRGNDDFEQYPFTNSLQEMNIDPTAEMCLILVNAQLETIKYRGNYVTIVINQTPGEHQVTKILTRYFYKSDLVFQLVDNHGKVSAQKHFTIPIKR